jgi:hypothetical protein
VVEGVDVVEGRCLGRFAFLAPPAYFTDFGHDSFFSFRGGIGGCVPKDGAVVKVCVGVKHFAVSESFIVECPSEKVESRVRSWPMSGCL